MWGDIGARIPGHEVYLPLKLGEIMKSKKVKRLAKKTSNNLNQHVKRFEKIERRKDEMQNMQ